MTAKLSCPVCMATADHFLQVQARDYFRCPNCQVRFLDPEHHLSRADEHTHLTRCIGRYRSSGVSVATRLCHRDSLCDYLLPQMMVTVAIIENASAPLLPAPRWSGPQHRPAPHRQYAHHCYQTDAPARQGADAPMLSGLRVMIPKFRAAARVSMLRRFRHYKASLIPAVLRMHGPALNAGPGPVRSRSSGRIPAVMTSSALVNRAISDAAPVPFIRTFQPLPDRDRAPSDTLARPFSRFIAGLPIVWAT